MFRTYQKGALLSLTIACSIGAAKPSEPLIVPPDFILSGAVENIPARFLVMANGVSYPVLNPELATRSGLSGGWLSVHMQVGPVMLKGQTAVVRIRAGGLEGKRRVLWFDQPIAPGADGALGPGAMQQPIIVFRIRPSIAGERDYILPLTEQDNALGTLVPVGRDTLFVQWDLMRAQTLSTAAAGQALAAAYQGRLEGSPGRMMIRFGVERPIRTLALGVPMIVGPIALRRVTMRIADYGNSSGIKEEGADDSEILVSAKSKLHPSFRLVIGATDMAACSSLTFDKPARSIVLRCAAQ